ncbi:MAG: hypothetical protein R2856_22040 [Caldilineaceae bacterium]
MTPDSAAPDDTASPSLLVSAGSAQGRLDVQSVDRLRLSQRGRTQRARGPGAGGEAGRSAKHR